MIASPATASWIHRFDLRKGSGRVKEIAMAFEINFTLPVVLAAANAASQIMNNPIPVLLCSSCLV